MQNTIKKSNEHHDEAVESFEPDIVRPYIYLYGEVSIETVTPIIKSIISYNITNPELSSINLFVNSHGGDMEQAFALIATIKASRIPINTVAIGVVSSSGLMIAMSGKKRYINKYTGVMSHLFTVDQGESSATELKYKQRDIKLTTQRMIDYYIECTGLDVAKVKKSLLPSHDMYLTPAQCIEMNLFDDFYESIEQIEIERQ